MPHHIDKIFEIRNERKTMRKLNFQVILIFFSFSNGIHSLSLEEIFQKKQSLKVDNYLSELSISYIPLSQSYWNEITHLNENYVELPGNLAKLIKVQDGCLHHVLSNQSDAYYGKFSSSDVNLQINYKHSMICMISGEVLLDSNTKLIENDCYFNFDNTLPKLQIRDLVQVLVLSWSTLINDNCPSSLKNPKTLYDILKMTHNNNYYLIHLADKYLSPNQPITKDAFIDTLKNDHILVNPTLPKWDSECQDMAEELFEILDVSKDDILDKEDLEALSNAKDRVNTQLWNKMRDYDEISFDMKVRLSGSMDFSLPRSEVEDIILALTRTDLDLWKQQKNFNNHDEL